MQINQIRVLETIKEGRTVNRELGDRELEDDITVGVIEVPLHETTGFGVMTHAPTYSDLYGGENCSTQRQSSATSTCGWALRGQPDRHS